MKKLGVLLLVLFFVGVEQVMAGATLYGVTFYNEFISIDTTTGAGTLIGNLDSNMGAFGLADYNGAIYTYDQYAGRIQQLDSTTGGTLATFDIGVETIGEGCIAFRNDGVGFMANRTLWSFDINGPSSTQITADDALTPFMDGLAFSSDGILYGLSQPYWTTDPFPIPFPDYKLYTIDQETGNTSLVGLTEVPMLASRLGGLAFTSDDDLYAVMNDSLFTIDLETGMASMIGEIGFSKVSGLTSLRPATVVPVPGALLLGSIGFGVVGFLKKKKII